jgi:hypothetical protein
VDFLQFSLQYKFSFHPLLKSSILTCSFSAINTA